jgi:hypothetical protein
MSSHRVPHKSGDDDRYEALVGWDNPCGSYFCTVFDTAAADPDLPVFSAGVTLPSDPPVEDLDVFAKAIEEHVVLTEIHREQLELDKARHRLWTPGPSQQLYHEMLRGQGKPGLNGILLNQKGQTRS